MIDKKLKSGIDPSVFSHADDVILELFNIFKRETNVCVPAIVEKVDGVASVTVRPLVKSVYNTEDGQKDVEREAVSAMLVAFKHGRYMINHPVSIGDTGWLIAGDRDGLGAIAKNSSYPIIRPDGKLEGNEGPQSISSFGINKFDYGFFIPASWAGYTSDYRKQSGKFIIGNIIDDPEGVPEDKIPPKFNLAYMSIDKEGNFVIHAQHNTVTVNKNGITLNATKRNVSIDPDADLDKTDAKFRLVTVVTGFKEKDGNKVRLVTKKMRVLADEEEYADDTEFEVGGGGGEPIPGPPGPPGASAGFGTPVATTTELEAGQPARVDVSASGPDTAKIFKFDFYIPNGGGGGGGPALATEDPLQDGPAALVGTSLKAAREDHVHPYGDHYVRNNAGSAPCNVLESNTGLSFQKSNGDRLQIIGGSTAHQVWYRKLTSTGGSTGGVSGTGGTYTNYTAISFTETKVSYDASETASGVCMLLGTTTVPAIFPSTFYIGGMDATNPNRTSISRESINFFPLTSSVYGGYVSFHYKGSNASSYTSRIIDTADGLTIRTNANTSAGQKDSIILYTSANKAVLQNPPTVTLANSKDSTDKNAIASVGWVGSNLKSLKINNTEIAKIVSTSDVNITKPTNTIEFLGRIRYNPAPDKHRLEMRIDKLNLDTGAVTVGEWEMIYGGQAEAAS